MRADALNFPVDPVRKKTTGMQQIPISYVCDLYKKKSKGIIADKKMLQVCFMDRSESESIIIDDISTEESESESVHKRINTNK